MLNWGWVCARRHKATTKHTVSVSTLIRAIWGLAAVSINDAQNHLQAQITSVQIYLGTQYLSVSLSTWYVVFCRQLQQQQQAELEVHQRDGLTAYDLSQVTCYLIIPVSWLGRCLQEAEMSGYNYSSRSTLPLHVRTVMLHCILNHSSCKQFCCTIYNLMNPSLSDISYVYVCVCGLFLLFFWPKPPELHPLCPPPSCPSTGPHYPSPSGARSQCQQWGPWDREEHWQDRSPVLPGERPSLCWDVHQHLWLYDTHAHLTHLSW